MNKLVEMIGQAAKIAAQAPSEGETLEWNAGFFGQAVSDWYDAKIPNTGTCVLIDVAEAALDARSSAPDATSVIYMQCAAPDATTLPANWQVSRRVPSDLRTREDDALKRSQAAASLLELQHALTASNGQDPWIGDACIDSTVAPFLLNTLQGSDCDLALAELSRVQSISGRFETLVLAADEPIVGAQTDCQGYDCRSFPLADEIGTLLNAAGFHGIAIKPLLERPVMILDGAELRVYAVTAHVGTKGACYEQGDAAVYLGPWSEVKDDDGHVYPRGVRVAVCAKTASVLQRAPYAGNFEIIQAYDRPDLADAELFDCNRNVVRPAAETKGRIAIGASLAEAADDACGTDCGC